MSRILWTAPHYGCTHAQCLPGSHQITMEYQAGSATALVYLLALQSANPFTRVKEFCGTPNECRAVAEGWRRAL